VGKRGPPPQRGPSEIEGIYLPVSNGQVAEQKSKSGQCGDLNTQRRSTSCQGSATPGRASLATRCPPPRCYGHTQGIAWGSSSMSDVRCQGVGNTTYCSGPAVWAPNLATE
jgi:hypothetical protein